jgi:ATP-dependent helicase HrpA
VRRTRLEGEREAGHLRGDPQGAARRPARQHRPAGGRDARAGEPPYLGARGIKFWPHPGSALAKKGGKWIISAELVETTRLFARCIARIEPEWVEEVGAHLLRRSTFEPHWSKSRGETVAWERGVIHGLTLYAKRACSTARSIRCWRANCSSAKALVNGDVTDIALKQMKFLQHNLDLVAQIERLEEKQRRQDLLVDESLIHAFYDSIVPAEVIDLRSFDAGAATPSAKTEAAVPDARTVDAARGGRRQQRALSGEDGSAGPAAQAGVPARAGAADDGVTLTVPLAILNQIPAARLDWLVPGLIEEKVLQLAKTVPPKLRHRLQPVAGVRRRLRRAGRHDRPNRWSRRWRAPSNCG